MIIACKRYTQENRVVRWNAPSQPFNSDEMWRRRRRQPNSHRDAGFLRCRFDTMPFEMQRRKSLIFIHVYRNKLLFTVAKLAVDRRFFLSLSLLFQLFVPQCTREINFALSIFQTRKESVFKCAPIRIVTWIIGRTKSKAKQQQIYK